jgi:hypothetical protein
LAGTGNGNDSSNILIHLRKFKIQRLRNPVHIDGVGAEAI